LWAEEEVELLQDLVLLVSLVVVVELV